MIAQNGTAAPVLLIREMTMDDLDAVIDIERRCQPRPWPATHFFHAVGANSLVYPIVGERGSTMVGFAVARYVADEIHIENIGVHPGHRRRGIAMLLMQHLFTRGEKLGSKCVHLEVRESNLAAIALYRKLGFEQTGVRKGYYTDSRENAILMTKSLLIPPLWQAKM